MRSTRQPRITDPHAIPVVGDDHHLDPVDPLLLTADSLRERFRQARDFAAPLRGDGALAGPDRAPARAAVLVGLVPREDALHVLLTRRTEHLRDHAGQISFPGGRAEAHDADAAATALREAQEEVGLDPGRVEVLGRLPAYTTVTSFVVTPVVALVDSPGALKLDPFEVDEAFEVPLAFLMDPAHHHRHEWNVGGVQRHFLSMPWRGPAGEYFIWGATAAMLRNLYAFLSR